MTNFLDYIEDGMGNIELQFIEYKADENQSDIYGIFNENIPECFLTFKQIYFIEHREATSNFSGNYNVYDIVFSVNKLESDKYIVTPAIVSMRVSYDDWYRGKKCIDGAFSKLMDNIEKYAKIILLPGEKKKTIKEFQKIK